MRRFARVKVSQVSSRSQALELGAPKGSFAHMIAWQPADCSVYG